LGVDKQINTIYLDEKVNNQLCDACEIRRAKRRLCFDFGKTHKLYLCDLCFDDIRELMLHTFWIGTRKTREMLEKENPVLLKGEKKI
jgi:hypothetical protein